MFIYAPAIYWRRSDISALQYLLCVRLLSSKLRYILNQCMLVASCIEFHLFPTQTVSPTITFVRACAPKLHFLPNTLNHHNI